LDLAGRRRGGKRKLELSWWFHKESVWNDDKGQAGQMVADSTENPHPPPE